MCSTRALLGVSAHTYQGRGCHAGNQERFLLPVPQCHPMGQNSACSEVRNTQQVMMTSLTCTWATTWIWLEILEIQLWFSWFMFWLGLRVFNADYTVFSIRKVLWERNKQKKQPSELADSLWVKHMQILPQDQPYSLILRPHNKTETWRDFQCLEISQIFCQNKDIKKGTECLACVISVNFAKIHYLTTKSWQKDEQGIDQDFLRKMKVFV